MFLDTREITDATTAVAKANDELKRLLIMATATQIVEVTEVFAPDETNFKTAIHIDGPDGDHSLIAVEDEIYYHLRTHPHLVDAMRSSVEFSNEAEDDTWRAARALVNESLESAEAAWETMHTSDKSQSFR